MSVKGGEKMKRLIHLTVTVVMVLSMVFGNMPAVSAASSGAIDNSSYDTGFKPHVYDGSPTAIAAWNEISQQMPQPANLKNKNGQYINLTIWYAKHLVVYGDYRTCNPRTPENSAGGSLDFKSVNKYPDNRGNKGYFTYRYSDGHTEKGEYRYMGYDYQGNKFSDPDFPADVPIENINSYKWTYMPWDQAKGLENESVWNRAADLARRGNPSQINQAIKNWIDGGTIYKTEGGQTTSLDFSSAETPPKNADGSYPAKVPSMYLNVLSAPTLKYPGEGRLWHKNLNGGYYYRTTSVAPIKSKLFPPAECKGTLAGGNLNISDFGMDASVEYLNSTVSVQIKVDGILRDESYYKDELLKTAYYTRYDINKIYLALNGSSEVEGVVSDNKGSNIFTVDFKIADILNLASESTKLPCSARILLQDGKDVSASGWVDIDFNVKGVELPKPPPMYTTPTVDLPNPAFDIVEYKPHDNTSMANIVKKEVYIDGKAVDYSTFFSGSFTFGIGGDGIRNVRILYTTSDGSVSFLSRWIQVYNTKPRVQFAYAGTYKQNRKMIINNTSDKCNDLPVISKYPITQWQWSFTALSEGTENDIKQSSSTAVNDMYKELLFKAPGTYRITLTGTNTLGRVSDPYVLDFTIMPDTPAAIIAELDNVVITRNEKISAFAFDVQSTDGDTIDSNKIELYYDENNDGVCEKLIQTWNNVPNGQFPTYNPSILGKYEYVVTATENLIGDTLPEFITAADYTVKTIKRDFWIDNLRPLTDIYIDNPVTRPVIDVYIMLDEKLDPSKVDYVKNSRIDFTNYLIGYNILPQVNIWDMHTYTSTQPANTAINSGGTYPSAATWYTSNGYSGTLSLSSVSDNGTWQDFGHYETKTETKTGTDTRIGYNWNYYTYNGSSWVLTSSDGTDTPSIWYSDGDGYSGTIYRTSASLVSDNGVPTSKAKKGDTYTRTRVYTGYYSGTVSRTVTYWVSNWQWVNNYTGFYSGTISKDVRQPYTDPFRPTSDKFVIYISDNNISQLSDLQSVMAKSAGKLVLTAQDSTKSQIKNDHFILNSKPIADVMKEALDWIANSDPAIPQFYVLAGIDTFNLNTSDTDLEGDPIISQQFQYVQDVNYFDNSNGREPGTVTEYSQTTGWTDTKVNKFDKVGSYSVYRRVQDQPSTDPNYSDYSYYSNEPIVKIMAHRKPVALARLDWDYSAESKAYLTNWVDMSYDLDHEFNRSDKGIVDRKIMFRKNGGDWSYFIPSMLTYGSYELQYYVKDPEGAWSDPLTMNFSLDESPPIQFKASLRTLDSKFSLKSVPASEYLEAFNIWTRYPYDVKLEMALYNGSTRIAPLKVIEPGPDTCLKTGNDIQWKDVSYSIPNSISDGKYTFKITAVDIKNPSIRNDKLFDVNIFTPIDLVPILGDSVVTDSPIDINASTAKYADSVSVTLFKGTAYQTPVMTMNGTPNGSLTNWFKSWNVPSNIPPGKGYIAEFKAYTPSGKSETKQVEFEVIDFKITGVSIVGDWSHWRGQWDIFGKLLTNEPHRFLSLENVRVNVSTTGYADKVVIRFSPQLENMQYIDINGHVYDYSKDFTGYYVSFPQDSTVFLNAIKKDSNISWNYIIPLAPSTKSWDDKRLHASYSMTVTVYKGGKSRTYSIDDIDITGNVYDLTYIQPVK